MDSSVFLLARLPCCTLNTVWWNSTRNNSWFLVSSVTFGVITRFLRKAREAACAQAAQNFCAHANQMQMVLRACLPNRYRGSIWPLAAQELRRPSLVSNPSILVRTAFPTAEQICLLTQVLKTLPVGRRPVHPANGQLLHYRYCQRTRY